MKYDSQTIVHKVNNDDDELLRRVKSKIDKMNEYNADQYDQIREDLEFSAGDQWQDDVAAEREREGRPMVVTNVTRQYVNRVVNPLRLKPIGIRITSLEEDLTKLLSGIVKDIEVKSNAYEAYEIAYENAVTGGIGFVGIGTDYVSKGSLEQKIVIESFRDPTMVYLDPYSTAVDGSDANFGCTVKFINADDAKDEFGEEVGGSDAFDLFNNWYVPEDSVAEMIFYELEKNTKTKYFYEDGESDELDESRILIAEKEVPDVKCHIFKFVGNKKVAHTELPIDFIPIVPVYGDSVYLENSSNIRYTGIVNWMKDSQRLINYYASQELELAAKAPKTPFIGAAGVFEGFEDKWASSNHKNWAYLEFNQTDLDGNPANAPQRVDNTPQTAALIASRNQVISELGRQTGLMDTSFGMQESNESGRAVLLRQNQGEISTAHYLQNLESSIAQIGRIILNLLPYVYDTSRKLTIRGEELEVVQDNLSNMLTPEVLQDLEVETESGPVYEGRRREAVAAILEIGAAMPDKMPLMADILVENLDAPGSKEIARRLRKTLPPELLPENEQGQAQMIQNLQLQAQQSSQMLQQSQSVIEQQNQQMAQMQQAISQLQQMVLSKEQEIQAKIYNANADRELDYAKTQLNNQAKITTEQIKQAGQDERQQQEIMADFAMQQAKNDAALDKEMAKLQGDLVKKQTPSPQDELNVQKEFRSNLPGGLGVADTVESERLLNDLDRFDRDRG